MLQIGDGLIEVPFLSEGQIKRTIVSGFMDQEEQKELEKVIDKSLNDVKPQPNPSQNKPNQPVNIPNQAQKIQNQPINTTNQQPVNNSNLVGSNRRNLGPSEEDIKTLTNLSFSREAAIRALRATNGDVEKAAALLFAESGNFF